MNPQSIIRFNPQANLLLRKTNLMFQRTSICKQSIKIFSFVAFLATTICAPLHLNAQSLSEIPLQQRLQILGQNPQARTLMEIYGISTYAIGADESCQLLNVGELRAFQVLKGRIAREIAPVAGDDVVAAIDQTTQGKVQATNCVLAPELQLTLSRARIIARALLDAPAFMTADPQKCKVEGEWMALERGDWQAVLKETATNYSTQEEESMYLGLRANFVTMVDNGCKIALSSTMVIPAFDLLRQKSHALAVLAPSKKSDIAAYARLKSSDPINDIGVWTSQQVWSGTSVLKDVKFYRMAATEDVKTGFAYLATPKLFDVRGRIYFTTEGRWIGEIGENIAAIELRFSDGTSMSMTKSAGKGSGTGSFSTFVLSDSEQKALNAKPDDVYAKVAFKEDGKEWRVFDAPGKDNETQKIELAKVRAGLAWATAPRAGD